MQEDLSLFQGGIATFHSFMGGTTFELLNQSKFRRNHQDLANRFNIFIGKSMERQKFPFLEQISCYLDS